MEYQVPQFIEVEDKIIGPLTLRQFIYLAGAGGLCVLLFVSLPLLVAILLSLPIVGFGGLLAFYRVNGKAFIEILEAGFNYFVRSKLFLWRKHEPDIKEQTAAATAAREAEEAAKARSVRSAPRLTRGKLSELAWSLDVSTGSEPQEK